MNGGQQLAGFSPADAERLAAFLAAAARPAGTLTYAELAGFLFAVATAPELVRPSEWMPLVFNDQGSRAADGTEAQAMLGLIMQLYNAVNREILEAPRKPPVLPPGIAALPQAIANFAADAPLAQWCRGFMAGYDWLQDVWQAHDAAPEGSQADEEFGAVLVTLGLFASREFAEAIIDEHRKPPAAQVRRLATAALADFPEAMRDLAMRGRHPSRPNRP